MASSSFVALLGTTADATFEGNGRSDDDVSALHAEEVNFGSSFVSIIETVDTPASSLSVPTAKRSVDDFWEIALNSANKSASSACPPRSPLNALGRLDVMPMFCSTGSTTVVATVLSVVKLESFAFFVVNSEGGDDGAATTTSTSPLLLTRVFFCFQGGNCDEGAVVLDFFFFQGFSLVSDCSLITLLSSLDATGSVSASPLLANRSVDDF